MLMVPSIPVIFNRHHTTAGGGGPATFFFDDFTGVDGSAPNARWQDDGNAGWQIQSNRLEFRGASYGIVRAFTGTGNQTFEWDQDYGNAGSTFAIFLFRFVDFNNYLYYQLNGSDILTFHKWVAGVDTLLQTDTVERFGSASGPVHGKIVVAGNSITITATGGNNPGSFGPFTESALAATGQGVGFGMNTGKSGNWIDNVQVTTP